MMPGSPSIVPEADDRDTYLVFNDYGKLGRAWCETDEHWTDRETLITYLMEGQYSDPVRVVAFNTAEGWSRDVSEEVADEIAQRCAADGFDIPTFLEDDFGAGHTTITIVAIIYNVGALLGGILFGAWSEHIGRRKTIVIAALLTIPVIPLWAFSHTAPLLALGGFAMQFMVQGAWGVIPAHLNELSPPAVRATFPGFAYQLGNLLSSRNSVIQAKLAEQHYGGNFAPVLAWTVLIVAILVAIVTMSGREARGADLSHTRPGRQPA